MARGRKSAICRIPYHLNREFKHLRALDEKREEPFIISRQRLSEEGIDDEIVKILVKQRYAEKIDDCAWRITWPTRWKTTL